MVLIGIQGVQAKLSYPLLRRQNRIPLTLCVVAVRCAPINAVKHEDDLMDQVPAGGCYFSRIALRMHMWCAGVLMYACLYAM